MHAVVVPTTLHDFDGAMTFLQEEVLPMVKQAPGFVTGYWVRTAGDKGVSMVVFKTEEAARAMAEEVRRAPSGAATADSIEVGEVVGHA